MRAMMCTVLLAAMFQVAGCSAPAVVVATDRDPSVDVSKFKTYTWHPQGMNSVGIPVQRAQLAQTYVRAIVEQELTRLGYQPATYTAPDFLVACTVGAVDMDQPRPWGVTYRVAAPGSQDAPASTAPDRQRSLLVEFIDRQSNQIYWRGWAHGVVTPGDAAKEPIETAVRSMLAVYPK